MAIECVAREHSSLVVSLLLTSFLLSVVGEQDEDVSEELGKVDEELNCVPDVVIVSASSLLDDHLGVVEDEGERKGESSPQDQRQRCEEGRDEKDQRGRGEGSSHVQELWCLGVDGAQ